MPDNHCKEISTPHEIVRQLFQEMKNQGVTPREMADFLDIDYERISDWKHNRKGIKLCYLENFARALGYRLTLEELPNDLR
jgi:transcriptional regulator with XRE-family HTH domain